MFYSQFLLAKRGPLGKLWLAAHGWGKTLPKNVIAQTNIKQAADSLKKPQTPLSLRVSGHLLLGLSKIYQRQVTYLYNDSNDAVLKIKAASRPGAASALELEDNETPANIDIHMPTHVLPSFEALTLQNLNAVVADDDWVAVPSRTNANAFRKGGRGVSLEDGNSVTREMVEEDTFYPASAARSSISEIEVARRDGRSGGRVSSIGMDEDERHSVYSDRDDTLRGKRGEPVVRRSLLEVAEMQARRNGGAEPVFDEDEAALARMMGLTTDDAGPAPGYMAGAGDVDYGGDYDYGGADYDNQAGMTAADTTAAGTQDGEYLDRLVTEDEVMAAASTLPKKDKQTRENERKARAAKRKEKKESRQQAVIADTSTILAGDTIKQWLQDASAIVRPSRRQAATDAFAARQGSEITAQFRKEAEKRLHAYENAMAKSNTDNSSMVGQLLFDNIVIAAPMLGPDGESLTPLTDPDTNMHACATIGRALVHTDIAHMLAVHASGKPVYPRLPTAEDATMDATNVTHAEHAAAPYEMGAGDVDYDDPYMYAQDDFGRGELDINIVASDAVDEHGNLRDSTTTRQSKSSAPNSAGKLSAVTFGTAEDADIRGAASDARSVASHGTSASHTQTEDATLNATQVTSAYVEKGKWHPQTVAMLHVLACEMTGAEVRTSGKKRKARESTDDSTPLQKYDLSDVTVGKGSAADPLSFLALAQNADRHAAAVSFYQLLVLRSWDVIDVNQDDAYDDIKIARTTRFAEALADHQVTA